MSIIKKLFNKIISFVFRGNKRAKVDKARNDQPGTPASDIDIVERSAFV